METLKLFDYLGWQDCGLIFFLFISTYINACVENNQLKLLVSFKKIYPSLYLKNIFARSAPADKKALPCLRGRKGGTGDPTVQRQVGERGTCQEYSLLQETWHQHHTHVVPK